VTIALSDLMALSQGALWSAFVVFLRVGAMLSLIPAFGERSVPVRLRLGLALGFTLIVLPAVATGIAPAPVQPTAILGILGAEVLAGLLYGMMLRLFVLTLQIAGTIAAQSTSLSQIFGGSAGVDPQPAIGHLLVIAGLALAALMGLHVRVATFMIHGYTLIPPGTLPAASVVADAGVREVARAFALAFTLSAPFVVASLLYNLTLGVINRAMPQLMVAFVGAPAITAGGLVLLLICAPIMLKIWVEALIMFMAMPFGGD
jgi:flagellar biosynthesis protein FliR